MTNKATTLAAVATIAVSGLALASDSDRFEEFRLETPREIALARSAAPAQFSDDATVWVLTPDGFETAETGSNEFHCLVLRGWTLPARAEDPSDPVQATRGVIAPICYDGAAAKADMREQFLQAELALAGKSPDEIRDAVYAAYGRGDLKPVDGVGFAYMMSAGQQLGERIGAWLPHLMIYAPYEEGSAFQNAFDSGLPIEFAAAGTARATFVVPLAPGHVGAHIPVAF